MLEQELNEFAHRLGLSGLNLDEGAVSMALENLGTITLQLTDVNAGRELLVMLSDNLPESDSETVARLLRSCDWRQNPPYCVSIGAFREKVFALTRIHEDKVTAAGIETALMYLVNLIHR